MNLLSNISLLIKNVDLVELNKILDPAKIKTDITFWGTRVISIDGYEKSVSINQIASLILNLDDLKVKDARKELLIPEAKKEAAYFITKKLVDIYNESDQQIAQANWITRIFVSILEWEPIKYCIEGCWPSIRGRIEDELDYRNHWAPHLLEILRQ